jgi:hypothetical protein
MYREVRKATEYLPNKAGANVSTFKKLLESVDRRRENRPVEVDMRHGVGEVWRMTNDYEFESDGKPIRGLGYMEVLNADYEG